MDCKKVYTVGQIIYLPGKHDGGPHLWGWMPGQQGDESFYPVD